MNRNERGCSLIVKRLKGIFLFVAPEMRNTFRERTQSFVKAKLGRPTLAELRAQAEGALQANKGVDLGKLSREERHKILFGR